MRALVAIPVYNEEKYVPRVIAHVLHHARPPHEVLVIDDGSTDRTPELLARVSVDVLRHAVNRGYGRSLRDAFSLAQMRGFDWVITIDCDEQHEPNEIPNFLADAAQRDLDVVSGSRYLRDPRADADSDAPPPDRRRINAALTRELNDRLGLNITDAFCGFKAYRVNALRSLRLSEDGYAFPMQFWVQAAANKLRIAERPVRLIYNDPTRTFGGPLDDADVRLGHYRRVLYDELCACRDRLPPHATANLHRDTLGPCGN